MLYLTLRQYEYILAVADAGSLTGAAARLNVSQPSLSVAITRVEDRLGERIFLRRKGMTIRATPYGHGLIAKARELVSLAEAIEAPKAPAPFTLACFQDIAPWYLAPALTRLAAHFPTRQFQGREGRFAALLDDLNEGRADLALSYDIGFPPAFGRRPIASVQPTAFLPLDHPLAHQKTLSLEALANHPLILFDEALSEGFMRDLLARLDLHPHVAHRVHSLEMMRSYAAHGAGIGISYSCPPGHESYDGAQLAQIPIPTPQARTEIWLIWSHLRRDEAEFEQIIACLEAL